MDAGISAKVIGEIILKTLSYFPELFTSNYTLTDIFAAVRFNGTILSVVANATGIDEKAIEQNVDLYFTVVQYLEPETATPDANQVSRQYHVAIALEVKKKKKHPMLVCVHSWIVQ